MNINDGSIITIESGGSLLIEENAEIQLVGDAKIIIEPGAFICIHPGANITFETDDSYIRLTPGCNIGSLNTAWENITLTTCGTVACGTDINQNSGMTYLDPYVIETDDNNTEWNSRNLYFNSNLEITEGETLELNSTNLYFADGSKIIVEDGATLELNNSELNKNACSDSWEGIEVESGGELIINNSTIENAQMIDINASIMELSENTTLEIQDNMLFHIENSGYITLKNGSVINNQSGGSLKISASPNITFEGNATININQGSYFCCGFPIFEFSSNSKITFEEGYITGTNPIWNLSDNCREMLCNLTEINQTNSDNYYFHTTDIFTVQPGIEPYEGRIINYKFDIIIPDGLTFDLRDGTILSFNEGSHIIVQDGGTLILENSTLTNIPECGNTWEGIEVQEGGELIIGENCIIENTKINIDGGLLTLNASNTFDVQDNTLLYTQNSGNIFLGDGSQINNSSGGSLKFDDASTITFEGNSKIHNHGGSYFCVEPETILDFQTENSYIFLWNNLNSVNPIWENLNLDFNCATKLCDVGFMINQSNYQNFFYDITNKIIDTDDEWTENTTIAGDIIIESGANLSIIENTELNFGTEGRIIVQPGGSFNINNSLLSNYEACETLWQGITVLGNSELPQSNTTNQGYLEINNNAIIENANTAVYVGNPESNNQTQNGGIIKIDGAIFRDNVTCIEMQEYQNYAFNIPEIRTRNVSYIRNSTFETTDYLAKLDKNPDIFIQLWSVDGIGITNNTFINENPEAYEITARGKGIKSWDANYFSKYNTFENLYVAVYPQGTGELSTFKIDTCIFTGNYKSLHLWTAPNAIVTRNNIDIAPFTGQGAIGISVYYSDDFTIEENTIKGRTEEFYDRGIIFWGTETNNSVYKNKFTNLSHATKSHYCPNLFFECNEFSENFNFSIYINKEGAFWTQGYEFEPAGNKFLNGNNEYDIFSTDIFISYYYSNSNPSYPSNVNDNISTNGFHTTNECLSHFGNINPWQIDTIIALDYMIQQKETELGEIVDGGNTESTVSDIENSYPEDALKLRNNLLEKSPNLSDTVMVSAITEEDILPEIMVTQVLTENPQSGKSENVTQALDNRENQLPIICEKKLIWDAIHYLKKKYLR